MTHHHIFIHEHCVVIAKMHDGAVLEVATRAHLDAIDIPPQHASVPDADFLAEYHAPNDRCARRDTNRGRHVRYMRQIPLHDRPRIPATQGT